MKKIKVGVIGVGYLGRFHCEKYASMDEAELVGIADLDEDRVKETEKKYGVKGFGNYKDLIGQVEAVSIVVPTTLHHRVARDFLMAGADVMVEKPMTCTLAEANSLIKLARAKKRILQVGHLERFNPAVTAMQEHVENPLFIESHRLTTFKGRGIDVDVVLDLMIHDIDIIFNLVKSDLKRVHAVGVPVITPFSDIANVHLEFRNGCTANVTVSRISGKNMRKIRVFQPHSYISVDYATREVTVMEKSKDNGEFGLPDIKTNTYCFPESDSLAEELRSFLQSVRNRQQPVVTGEDGRRALQLALQITKQIRNNMQTHEVVLNQIREHDFRAE